VHDDRRLLDGRKAVLDAILERRARRGTELLDVAPDAVACREGDQGHWLARGLPQAGEDLTAPAAPGGVDGRPGEHHRSDALGPPDGEFGDDLAAHRVGDERRPLEPELVEPRAQRIGVLRDPGGSVRPLAAPVARQVRDEGREPVSELPCQRDEVSPRDAVAVDEDDGVAAAAVPRMDAETVDAVEAALETRL
jgi:hypothetical protein